MDEDLKKVLFLKFLYCILFMNFFFRDEEKEEGFLFMGIVKFLFFLCYDKMSEELMVCFLWVICLIFIGENVIVIFYVKIFFFLDKKCKV